MKPRHFFSLYFLDGRLLCRADREGKPVADFEIPIVGMTQEIADGMFIAIEHICGGPQKPYLDMDGLFLFVATQRRKKNAFEKLIERCS
jgi:hypothetical protein